MTESAAQNENQAASAAAPEKEAEQPQQAAGAAPEKSAEAILKEQLEVAEKKIAENYDLYVRAMADLENTRRRADADVLKAHKYSMKALGEAGLSRVDILCPSFTCDCLETCEEIEIDAKVDFLKANPAGVFHYIPCINASDEALAFYAALVREELQGWI